MMLIELHSAIYYKTGNLQDPRGVQTGFSKVTNALSVT